VVPPCSCEINAVDHCNISCLDCNHASPVCAARVADPEAVCRDLSGLARHYKPDVVKIIGGEPLLHPELPELVRAVRRSAVSERIMLVTNGLLLRKMPSQVWEEIDELELSIYPETGHLLARDMPYIQAMLEKSRTKLSRYCYKNFRVTFSTAGSRDKELAQRIYRTCELARLWGCQSVHEGHFFKCPMSIYVPRILDRKQFYDYRENGVGIHAGPGFRERLIAYLESKEPLRACHNCLGSVGIRRDHRIINKADWLSGHAVPTEELVDYERLLRLEAGRETADIDKNLME